MKKILLGTTTLIGAAALFSGAALADGPKVTLGGVADFQAGFLSDDNDADQRSGAFRSDTEVTLDIKGVADNGLTYGGHIMLETDVEGANSGHDSDNQGFNAGRTYLFVEGSWGRLQGGSDLGVTKTMKVDASNIARATGGIDGDFRYWGLATTGPGTLLATPDLILDHGPATIAIGANERDENLNKLSYYTPRFSGFQAGISYLFDTAAGSRGQVVALGDNTAGQAEGVILGAVNWEGKFDQIGINVGATGEWGDSESTTTEDLQTWQAGAMLTYMGFSVAGSYGDWGDSLLAVATNDDERHFWTAGVAYETGPFGASITYLKSETELTATTENEFDNISVGVDYKLAPGFTPYAEVSFFEVDEAGTGLLNDNDGSVFILGSQLAF